MTSLFQEPFPLHPLVYLFLLKSTAYSEHQLKTLKCVKRQGAEIRNDRTITRYKIHLYHLLLTLFTLNYKDIRCPFRSVLLPHLPYLPLLLFLEFLLHLLTLHRYLPSNFTIRNSLDLQNAPNQKPSKIQPPLEWIVPLL